MNVVQYTLDGGNTWDGIKVASIDTFENPGPTPFVPGFSMPFPEKSVGWTVNLEVAEIPEWIEGVYSQGKKIGLRWIVNNGTTRHTARDGLIATSPSVGGEFNQRDWFIGEDWSPTTLLIKIEASAIEVETIVKPPIINGKADYEAILVEDWEGVKAGEFDIEIEATR